MPVLSAVGHTIPMEQVRLAATAKIRDAICDHRALIHEVEIMTTVGPKTIAVAALVICMNVSAFAESFKFVALGDMPYGKPEAVNPKFEALISAINKRKPAFVIHVGDTKSSNTICSDAVLNTQLAYMNAFESALIYTPGDNEWTDCHQMKAGRFDPLERLAFLRKTYFKDAKSLGRAPITVERQADQMLAARKYVENARFQNSGVLFLTAHVVGSNNNFEIRDPAAVAEFFERDKANIDWLKGSFERALATNAKAVVVAIHADMFEFGFMTKKEAFVRHSGFKRFAEALVAGARAFGKPVLLIYGDSHIYRVFQPFPRTGSNIMALEVFGAANMHAVEVSVDPADPAVFGIRPVFHPAK